MPAGKRIVVTDDNKDGADSLAELLRLKGHEAFVAYNGETAVELVARVRPDVVLLDILMPGLDGCETARKIRAGPAGQKCLIAAVTGLSRTQLQQRLDVGDFDFYFMKPVDIRALDDLLAASPSLERSLS